LDELFGQETERLLVQLGDDAFKPQGQVNEEEIRKRIHLYESLTEPLGRMAGVLGRWGDDAEFALILDVIRGIYYQAERPAGGLTVFLNLRSYPAVLVFTAYALGLTKAKRWSTLRGLLMATLTSEGREPKRLVSTLFLWAWAGGDKAVWQALEGLNDRKTPLSDHLLEVMAQWQKSFVGVDANFELLFERFEMLASLVHFEENDEAQLEGEMESAQHRRDVLAWMPMGRAGWHSSSARTLLQELEEEGFVLELLHAGYAKDSRRFLELYALNFKLYAGRMSW
jgi:hypothetical protein